MDPITLAILAGTAASAAGNLPALIPSKYEREQKKRLKKLQAQDERGELGLTDREEALIRNKSARDLDAVGRANQRDMTQLMAGSLTGTTSPQALIGAQLSQEGLARSNDAIRNEIESRDIARRDMQIEEMRALEAGQGQVQADRRAAVGAMLGSAIEAGVKTSAQQKIIQGARAPSPSSVLALSKQLGVSEDEARGIIETSVTNPELMKYLTMVKGVK